MIDWLNFVEIAYGFGQFTSNQSIQSQMQDVMYSTVSFDKFSLRKLFSFFAVVAVIYSNLLPLANSKMEKK